MSDSKSGSKDNLNESNMPLLSDDGAEKAGETPEKEVIEMELEEKKDDSTEKGKDGKKKKEKKVKVPKVKADPGPSCIDTLSSGLDMTMRDNRGINREIDLDFDDVLAEPSSAHGFDPIWRLSFVLFSQTKLWIYRIISAIVAVPLSIIWAVIFSLLSVVYVWIVRPILRIVELFLAVFKRLWVSLLQATLEPLCDATGAVFGRVRVSNNLVQSA
eukprot:GFUD01036786.1.p1 GENE.GFUD01036786.1~~GFUD01036786.1.p1  ORF type:complete len:215 (-),score=72.13 GFUD01036786.1:88-732(-)